MVYVSDGKITLVKLYGKMFAERCVPGTAQRLVQSTLKLPMKPRRVWVEELYQKAIEISSNIGKCLGGRDKVNKSF